MRDRRRSIAASSGCGQTAWRQPGRSTSLPRSACKVSSRGTGHCDDSTRTRGSALGSGPSAEGSAIQTWSGTFKSEYRSSNFENSNRSRMWLPGGGIARARFRSRRRRAPGRPGADSHTGEGGRAEIGSCPSTRPMGGRCRSSVEPRVGLMSDLNGPRGDPDLLFLGQAQDLAAAGPMNHVPERNPAAVALNDLADEVSRQSADRLAVALPEPDPVGQGHPGRNSIKGPTSNVRPFERHHANWASSKSQRYWPSEGANCFHETPRWHSVERARPVDRRRQFLRERHPERSPGAWRAWTWTPAGSAESGRCMPRPGDRQRARPTEETLERPRYTRRVDRSDVAHRTNACWAAASAFSSSGVERRPICTQSDNWLRMSLSLPRASSTASM